MLEAIGSFLGDSWPLLATALLALTFAGALSSRQEKGRRQASAERSCLDAIRDFRRLAAAAATRRALGGVMDEVRRAEDAVCPFLVKVLDDGDQLPRWKRRLLFQCLVNLGGHDVYVARKLGCAGDPRSQGDFWLSVYQQFRLHDELTPQESSYLSEREARFGAHEDWDGVLEDLNPIETAIRTPAWRLLRRIQTRPSLGKGIRRAIERDLM